MFKAEYTRCAVNRMLQSEQPESTTGWGLTDHAGRTTQHPPQAKHKPSDSDLTGVFWNLLVVKYCKE